MLYILLSIVQQTKNQNTYSIAMIIQMLYHWMRFIRFRMKILAASDTESDCALRCAWVLSLHLYR